MDPSGEVLLTYPVKIHVGLLEGATVDSDEGKLVHALLGEQLDQVWLVFYVDSHNLIDSPIVLDLSNFLQEVRQKGFARRAFWGVGKDQLSSLVVSDQVDKFFLSIECMDKRFRSGSSGCLGLGTSLKSGKGRGLALQSLVYRDHRSAYQGQ